LSNRSGGTDGRPTLPAPTTAEAMTTTAKTAPRDRDSDIPF
jgi:hypothetical protein